MTIFYFDTLGFSQKIIEAGMPRKQAETLAILQKEAFELQNQYLLKIMDEKISSHYAKQAAVWAPKT